MSQSYANYCGSGSRLADIAVTFSSGFLNAGLLASPLEFVNGDTTSSYMYFPNATSNAGKYIRFDFGVSRIIDEIKWYQSGSDSHGTWKVQGSADGSSWSDVGSSFTLGGASTQTITAINGNTTAYRHWQLLGVSGNTSWNVYIREVEFKIDSAVTDTFPATSYANSGGTGNRLNAPTGSTDITLGAGTIANLLTRNLGSTTTYFNVGAVSGKYIRFDFGAAITADEIKWYQQGGESHGTWKVQGSPDASTWTDIGSSFTLGGSTAQTITAISANTTAYRYYQLLGVSGNTSGNPFLYAIEFHANDRTGITFTSSVPLLGPWANIVNGDTTESTFYLGSGSVSGYLRWDFGYGSTKLVREIKWYMAPGHPTDIWKVQASNDASTWVDIGFSFTLGCQGNSAAYQIIGCPFNSTAYRYWQLLGVSGTLNQDSYIREVEFKLVDGPFLGSAAITQAAHTLSSAGAVAIVGASSLTQAAHTLSSTGSAPATGTATLTQADQTLSATGVLIGSVHTAQALRESTSIASGVETYQGWASVYASFACLVEPMPAFRQVTFFGVVSGGVFCVTWGDETLHEGDRIVWNGRTFTLKLSVDDRYRGTDTSIEPYQTGVLTEDVLSRG